MTDIEKSSYGFYINNATISQENYSASLTPLQISEKFVDYNHSTILYKDTVFYLHLYNSLYLALYKYNDENNNDVSKFTTLINNLVIKLDTTTTIITSPATSIGVLVTAGTVASPTYTFTYYTRFLITAYTNTLGSVTKGQVLTYTVTDKPSGTILYTQNNLNEYINYDGTTTDAYNAGLTLYTLTFTPAVSSDFTVNTNKYYTRSGSVGSFVYTLISSQPNTYTSATNDNLTTTQATAIANLALITSGNNYTQIELYKLSSSTTANPLTYTSPTPTIVFKVLTPTKYSFILNAVSGDSSVSTSTSRTVIDINPYYKDYLKFTYKKYLPILTNITDFYNPADLTAAIIPITAKEAVSGGAAAIAETIYDLSINKSSYSDITLPKTTDYTDNIRQNLLKYILKDILNTRPETIMGYLLWHKINFNVNLYKLSIQYIIRANYLHNSDISTYKLLAKDDLFKSITLVVTTSSAQSAGYPRSTYLIATNTYIENMKTNIDTLTNNVFSIDTNDYLSNKYQYTTKIENLTKIKEDYEKIQNSLNIAVKEYNKHLKNFTNIKQYASYIVIFLIILIIATIIITILPTITPEIKSTYYVITFIILSIVTYFFNNRFNHVNLYEKFTIQADPINYWSDKTNYAKNHYYFYNNTIDNITAFNEAVKKLTNKVRNNIYTIGDKTFTVDANTYLYKLYLEKKNQLEVNRLKKVSLTNFIESMKKQVLYLFNIIVFISNLIIILLLGLMLYSGVPFLLPYIIALCVILTVILVVYFMIAIIQPTRMIASKNYWANNRPDADILNNL